MGGFFFRRGSGGVVKGKLNIYCEMRRPGRGCCCFRGKETWRAKQQHAVVLVLGGPAAGLSGWGLCNGSLLVNLLTLMAMHGVVNIFFT